MFFHMVYESGPIF